MTGPRDSRSAALAALDGRRLFVTGHTGFKGSWMCLCLEHLGAQVTGYALAPPTQPSLFEAATVRSRVDHIEADLRDYPTLESAMREARPDIVIHLAAQSLVLDGYKDPRTTFETNLMGTVNVLEAVRQTPTVRAVVNVTTDKCYRNEEWVWSYRENDPLGGGDPYSSSKACAELATAAYTRSFFEHRREHPVAVATARAGNVIGGGDWAQNRIVPDCIRAFLRSQPASLRNPESIRPWQHVLEPTIGYLRLAVALMEAPERAAGAWNFGPTDNGQSVGRLGEHLARSWPTEASVMVAAQAEPAPPESATLRLNSEKARLRLGWRPRWGFEQTVALTAAWYAQVCVGNADAAQTCRDEIERYLDDSGSVDDAS